VDPATGWAPNLRMTDGARQGVTRRPARHERPAIDEAGLIAARHADRLLAEARDRGLDRWVAFFEPLPDRLRDEEPVALRSTAIRSRAAYGVKDSVRDALPAELTEPFLDSVDRLLRELNRDLHRSRG
jgi:hypothetical protein